MNRKSKRYAAGGEADEKAKEGLFSGKAAEDDSDTYAPKTKSYSETGPDEPKAKAKEPKASQDDAFPKKDREKEKEEKPARVSSGASGFPTKKKEKAPYEGFKKGGSVSASSRGDGIAQRGKTKGRMI